MSHIQKEKLSQKTSTLDETILVVERSLLFDKAAWTGLKKVDMQDYMKRIQKHKTFIARTNAETDTRYKQIIPYLVFEHNGNYFMMQRKGTASETRLANKYTLGIGGHIREEDISGTTIFDWAKREFAEEVDYQGDYTIEPLGILNDDSNDVGKVHIGFVFLLKGTSANIRVKSELKSGTLMSYNECCLHYDVMETWSQMVLDSIKI